MAGYYKIVSCANENLVLNVALTGELVTSQTISGRTNVDLQPYSDVYSKMWYINDLSSTAAQPIRTRTNLVFMLNAQRPTTDALCNVYTANSDTDIKIVSAGSGTYRLQLNSTSNRYLTAIGTVAGSGVNWQALNSSSNAQKWKIVKLNIPAYPTAPADYTYTEEDVSVTVGNKTYEIPLRLFKVDASKIDKIGFINVVEQNVGIPVPYCGCNGGFFDPGYGTHGSHNIALNNGVPVGPDFIDAFDIARTAGDYNGVGSWNIAYYNGEIRFEQAKNTKELIIALGGVPVWAQGGVSLDFGNPNWVKNWEAPSYGVDVESQGRTMLVANKAKKELYMFVHQTGNSKIGYTIRVFRQLIIDRLNIPENGETDFVGLMLDGGGSSCLRGYNSSGTRIGKDTSRPLCQIIYIKP